MPSPQRRYDVDVATQVPHAALRVYVMGERGANREPATEADRRRMAELTAEGLRAGALGFSTSRTLNHRAADGRSIPTLRAEEAELTAIAHAMRETGAGWLQIVSDFEDQMGEIGLFRRLAKESGRPITISMLQSHVRPDGWRTLLAEIDEANKEGFRITAQVRSRPTSVLLGFELSQNPFMGRPSYKAIAHLPFAERLALLRKPEFRARILKEAFEGGGRERRVDRWDRMFPFGDPPDYEPKPESSIAARAAREGRTPEEVAYDLLLRARRQGDALPARHQLRRGQPRRRARDDRRTQHADRPGRRRRACRHHVRRHRHQLHADPLDARSRAARCSRWRGPSSGWRRTMPRRSGSTIAAC